MANRRFSYFLSELFQAIAPKTIAKGLGILLMGAIALMGFSPAVALANPLPNLPVALAASSRFAAQAEAKDQEPMISEERLSELREQRREWQSEASAAAAAEGEVDTTGEPVAEAVKDKLNLEEITDENEIVGRIVNN
jgi:hypothetical protein